MDRFIDTIEMDRGRIRRMSRQHFIAVCSNSSIMRSGSSISGAMLLGILIFWASPTAIAADTHVELDLGQCRSKYQRMIDVFATLVCLLVTVQTWTLFDKVRAPLTTIPTFDMHMPAWPFFAVAWPATSRVLLIAIRTTA